MAESTISQIKTVISDSGFGTEVLDWLENDFLQSCGSCVFCNEVGHALHNCGTWTRIQSTLKDKGSPEDQETWCMYRGVLKQEWASAKAKKDAEVRKVIAELNHDVADLNSSLATCSVAKKTAAISKAKKRYQPPAKLGSASKKNEPQDWTNYKKGG